MIYIDLNKTEVISLPLNSDTKTSYRLRIIAHINQQEYALRSVNCIGHCVKGDATFWNVFYERLKITRDTYFGKVIYINRFPNNEYTNN